MVRIFAFLLLLISILFWPFWVSVILGLAGVLYFSKFWEVAILFLLSDLLYGAKEVKFNNMLFITFVVASFILILIEILKTKLKLLFKASK